jgi:hypothetical protein
MGSRTAFSSLAAHPVPYCTVSVTVVAFDSDPDVAVMVKV